MTEPFKYQRIFLHAGGVIPGPTGTAVGDWEAAVDEVVAAVREDLICGAVGKQLVENGRAAAAEDIRADYEKFAYNPDEYYSHQYVEHYARIAEGATDD